MNKRHLLYFAVLSLTLASCSSDSSDAPADCNEDQKEYMGKCYSLVDCVPGCNEETEKCVNGTCYDKAECVPQCNSEYSKCVNGRCLSKDVCVPSCNAETEQCYKGECYDSRLCLPECEIYTQKCADGKCIGLDECYPKCTDGLICNKGKCETPDPTLCEGTLCKNDTTYCDETGHWKACAEGYGCNMGYCIKGVTSECEDKTCSEDKTQKCDGGTWVSCGSLETCTNGKCELPADLTCDPGTCSADNTYRCNAEGKYEPCFMGTACNEGICEDVIDQEKAMLWQLCQTNSECAHGICVFELSASRTMSANYLGLTNVELIPMSKIDSRIPDGYGVCSRDCTRDATVCDNMSSGILKFTCQVAVVGDSPYPPKDQFGAPKDLPFHRELNLAEMETAPFASLCRPNDINESFYSKTFCEPCTSSASCSTGESCVMGTCLPQCSRKDMCPIGFSCTKVGESGTTFCTPDSGTCDSCLDFDDDGQGFGACERDGYDCDDTRNDVYYGKKLNTCTRNYTDDNCNGKIDYTEVIRSADFCSSCDDPCKTDKDAKNITRSCEDNNGGKELDDSTPEAIDSTYIFQCKDKCDEGYADCDGDVSNGCETQLVIVGGGIATPTEYAVTYSLDSDGDGHGVMDAMATHYCCKNRFKSCNCETGENCTEEQKAACDEPYIPVCYAMPNTNTNPSDKYWDKITLNANTKYSTIIDDCDDKNANRFGGNPDICDGLDNDCDDKTADGSASYIKFDEVDYKYVEASESDENKLALEEKCAVYEASEHTLCTPDGKVACKASGTAEYKMVCYNANSTEKDDDCDGIDDNCNGQIDEDYVFTSCTTNGKGICAHGYLECKDGKTNCKQLFTKRETDFYGDGVDSNCDGYDWDDTNAVFVAKYSNNDGGGSDKHSGTKTDPVASLNKAIELAFKTLDDKYIVHDIIVNKDAAIHSKSNWGKEMVNIPAKIPNNTYTFSLEAAHTVPGGELTEQSTQQEILDAHIAAYQKKLKDDPDYINYDPNNYLLNDEVYPRKEFVAIYGGFNSSWENNATELSPKDNSTYNYTLDSTNANTNSDKSLQNNYYEMIGCDGSKIKDNKNYCQGSLSLKLDHIYFNMSASTKVYAKQSGTTFIGISCGGYMEGCEQITLDNSDITVTAPNGVPGITPPTNSNNNWDGAREGVDSAWHVDKIEDDNETNTVGGGLQYYFVMSERNLCFTKARSLTGLYPQNHKWLDIRQYSYPDGIGPNGEQGVNFLCPDGISPLGGCGGSYCGRKDCHTILRRPSGRDGYGIRTKPNSDEGKGARITSVSNDGCGTNNIADTYTEPRGKKGSLGTPGTGGSTDTLLMRFNATREDSGYRKKVHYVATMSPLPKDSYIEQHYPKEFIYTHSDNSKYLIDSTDAANGTFGISGSGGGGGGVYQSHDHEGTIFGQYVTETYWMFAGTGGAGGCGGYGGGAGGTGGSAIGIQVRPPEFPSYFIFKRGFNLDIENSKIKATAGAGGAGGAGQAGIAGGTGGKGLIYGKEGVANRDTHCHKSTAGGAGGPGGGGGGGAGGLSGQAYGMMFVCPKTYGNMIFEDTSALTQCGIIMPDSLTKNPDKIITVRSQENGSAGTDGKIGYFTGNETQTPDADFSSTGGDAGSGGTVPTSTELNLDDDDDEPDDPDKTYGTAEPFGYSDIRD
ncbi:MAG: putative metal-binding motif-containing protein [Proteobacteria bacterium]|nr:putative metal-binding motif-containing protein [Pseudomonadota bacterium]